MYKEYRTNVRDYISFEMTVPFVPIKNILERAKNLKTDTVFIPQFPCGIFPNKIMGLSANSIISIADFKDLSKPVNSWILWDNMGLRSIQLYLKDVNPFLKVISDTAEAIARKENNITDPKAKLPKGLADKYLPKECTIIGHKYATGTIATVLNVYDKSGNIIVNTLGNNTVVKSSIQLHNFDFEYRVEKMNDIFNHSDCIVKKLDISEDKNLLDIIGSKATDGSKLWCPCINLRKYTTYINKAFLNISKGDKVYISIYDNIQNLGSRYYAISFDIDKIKKGIHLNTSFAAFKLV